MRFGSDNPEDKPVSPIKREYEFKSKQKQFVWYDKEAQKKVSMNLPAHLIIPLRLIR